MGWLRKLLSWVLPAAGFCLFLVLVASPRLTARLATFGEDWAPVDVRSDACRLSRDGWEHTHVVRCDFSYAYAGQPYRVRAEAWSSDSPLIGVAGLNRALAQQSDQGTRQIMVRHKAPQFFNPQDILLSDLPWLAAPSFGYWLAAIFLASCALAGWLLRDARVARSGTTRRRRVMSAMLMVVAMLCCFYGLSNRLGNASLLLGLGDLQPVPAQRDDCRHDARGKHDQIECTFQYRYAGQAWSGQAEAIDYRLFPTDARIDDEVGRLNRTRREVTAYVDPQHPGYAIAFASDAWLLPYSWGLLELIKAMLLLFVLPHQLVLIMRLAASR